MRKRRQNGSPKRFCDCFRAWRSREATLCGDCRFGKSHRPQGGGGGRTPAGPGRRGRAPHTPAPHPCTRALAGLVGVLTGELRELRDRVRALDDGGRAPLPTAAGFALADRYALLLAGAAVLGVWHHAGEGGDPFLADAAWAAAALHQVARRLGARVPALPRECEARLRQETRARFGTQHSYDLYNTPLYG
ncbi:hypothetical protein ACFXD5_00125 [Streptomyces sp. NPDC059385]|uniref:hypothetical protein n=1 Tax=Streptomyces sp. NPDC059385 TaxID=3346817 RepID=UPI00369110AE